MERKVITVFGSSRPVAGDEEFELAYRLGKMLAKRDFDVCTGGYGGIMRAVSKGAAEEGGEAIGVLVRLWGTKPNEFLSREILCNNLFERINTLIEKGDGYAVLQGGTGTLLEFSAVWELLNKEIINRKPVAAHSEMWKNVISVMEKQIEREKRESGLIRSFETIEEMADYLRDSLK